MINFISEAGCTLVCAFIIKSGLVLSTACTCIDTALVGMPADFIAPNKAAGIRTASLLAAVLVHAILVMPKTSMKPKRVLK